jgi:hypothetical protein
VHTQMYMYTKFVCVGGGCGGVCWGIWDVLCEYMLNVQLYKYSDV